MQLKNKQFGIKVNFHMERNVLFQAIEILEIIWFSNCSCQYTSSITKYLLQYNKQ